MDTLDYLSHTPEAFILVVGLFGLVIGSFLNVVIYRLPLMMERDWRMQCRELLDITETEEKTSEPFNLIIPRSRCPRCGHNITALENIPVLSYLVQGGRCTACRERISLRYPTIEILSALLAGVTAWHLGFGWPVLGALIFTWTLIVLSIIDIDHQLLHDDIVFPLLWLGLLCNLFNLYVPLSEAVIGAMAGYLSLWSVYWIFKLTTGKEGMGYGDFKLLATLGAWMGWKMLPLIILLSSVVGTIVGISLILLQGRDKNIPIPFGPYLACAGWIALLWGKDLTHFYLTLSI